MTRELFSEENVPVDIQKMKASQKITGTQYLTKFLFIPPVLRHNDIIIETSHLPRIAYRGRLQQPHQKVRQEKLGFPRIRCGAGLVKPGMKEGNVNPNITSPIPFVIPV
jgi:hypothetical protein